MNVPKFLLSLFFVLCSLALCITGLVNLASNGVFYMHAQQAGGRVSIIPGNPPTLVFSDRYSDSHVAQFKHIFAGTLSDGQQVTVLYNPANSNEVSVSGFIYLWAIGTTCFLIGLAALIISLSSVDWIALKVTLGLLPPDAMPPPVTPSDKGPKAIRTGNSKDNKIVSMEPENMGDMFGVLKPLIEDKDISDIIISSPSTIHVKKGSQVIKTSHTFPNQQRLEQLVDRMLNISDNSYSISKPIVDGMVTPIVRIHAVHKALCEDGPYVTLRISRVSAVKYQDLCRGTMAPREIISYLRAMLLTGHTILIAGEVGTGKTTLIRALASTIPAQESILVIEDTPEIRIEHPAVRYVHTRESNTEGVGKVSPGECIRAGMRMAMNRIIFGEIRDPEAAESFIDVCVSGHPGMSTIHARSAFDALARLELFLARQQPGVDRHELKEQIGSAVQVIAYTRMCKETGQRRISEVLEIERGTDQPVVVQPMFNYSASGKMPVWKVLNRRSFFASELKDFEGGYSLENLSDYLTFPTK